MQALKCRRGFTLIELLVVLGITGVVITAIASFLVSNLKTFNKSDSQVEAQFQAQAAVGAFVDRVMGAKGILSVTGLSDGSSLLNTPVGAGDAPLSVGSIILDNDVDSSTGSKRLIFSYDGSRLAYGYSDSNPSAVVECASGITSFKLAPLPAGATFAAAAGIKLEITAVAGSGSSRSEITLKNEVYFRNHTN